MEGASDVPYANLTSGIGGPASGLSAVFRLLAHAIITENAISNRTMSEQQQPQQLEPEPPPLDDSGIERGTALSSSDMLACLLVSVMIALVIVSCVVAYCLRQLAVVYASARSKSSTNSTVHDNTMDYITSMKSEGEDDEEPTYNQFSTFPEVL